MPIDYAVLATEIALPAYAGQTDQGIADLLNAPNAAIQIGRIVTADEVMKVIPAGAWGSLSAVQREKLDQLLRLPKIEMGDVVIQGHFSEIFPNGSVNTALTALRTRNGSRAEQLFGAGTTITSGTVTEAKARAGM